jgi:hypothetical protein
MQIAYSDLERLIRPADTAKRDQNAKGDQKPGHINSPKIRPCRFRSMHCNIPHRHFLLRAMRIVA